MSHAINDDGLDVIFRNGAHAEQMARQARQHGAFDGRLRSHALGADERQYEPGAHRVRRLERSEGTAEAVSVGRQSRQDHVGAGHRDHRL